MGYLTFKDFIWKHVYDKDLQYVLDKIDIDEKLSRCTRDKSSLTKDNEALVLELDKLNKSLLEQEMKLKRYLDNEEEQSALEKYWNDRYPKALIVYRGRSLPFSETPISVPVSVLITPNDPYIKADLEKWGLMGKNDTDWETHAPKIYNKIKSEYYKYDYDRNVWGNNEVWEFPYEMRAKGFGQGFDCDSWAIFQASYYIAAGMPRWRVRVVAGGTEYGGHATVYLYSMSNNKWVHLNSTYSNVVRKELKEYPTHDDALLGRDKIGISTVWFSFNDKYAWIKFRTDVQNEFRVLKMEE